MIRYQNHITYVLSSSYVWKFVELKYFVKPPTFKSGLVMMLTMLVVTMMKIFIIKHHIMLTMA